MILLRRDAGVGWTGQRKKTDVAEYSQVFDRVGLLVNNPPPATAEWFYIQSSDDTSQLLIGADFTNLLCGESREFAHRKKPKQST